MSIKQSQTSTYQGRFRSLPFQAICSCAALACLSFVTLSGAQAAPVVFTGLDAGAGPGDPRPNSDAAAASFLAAAGLLGPVTTIDMESVPLVSLSGGSQALDGTVTASASAGAAASIDDGGFADSFNGFATSPDQFIWMNAAGASNRNLSFAFATPIQAFGAYITGLGTAGGSTINIDFNDGSAQNFQLTGDSSGGVLYWGFTSAGNSINSISFTQDNASDAFGVDDVSYVGAGAAAVPEPSTFVLAALGVLGLGCVALRKKYRRA